MPSLTILTSPQAGTTFELASRTLSLGRDPARDVQIIDPRVSRKHAVVRMVDDRHAITPIKARNGVLVNNERIEGETVLHDGDEIILGETVLRYQSASADDKTNAVFARKQLDRDLRDANTML